MTDDLQLNTMIITAKCRGCGALESTQVLKEHMYRFKVERQLVQVAFPEATPEQREIILQSEPGGWFIGSNCGCWGALTEEPEEGF